MSKVNLCNLDTAQLPRLTNEECEALLKKSSNGDEKARETLVMANIRLVLSLVQRFRGKANSDDLFQVGIVGLIKAIDGFDPSFNVRFSTYAVPMVAGEIRRFIKEGTSIKVSRSMRDVAYKALRAKEQLEGELNKVPTAMEIAEEIDIPLKEVVCALDAVSEPVYLQDSVFGDGEDTMSLEDQIGDSKNTAENWNERICLKDAIKELPDKERKVVYMRYYLGKTQTEISREISISQAQVSRLEKTALERLRSRF